MKLIADSGSTKTDWVLIDGTTVVARYLTQGINPFHQSGNDILTILRLELLPQLPSDRLQATDDALQIYFYGSGVRPELEPLMHRLLTEVFPHSEVVSAHGDLLGAARAVCGNSPGVAAILGTGANSGLYDGTRIVQNTPPLGYILGDEGSGAVLGERFLNALYKGFLPATLLETFEHDQQMDMATVISRVYRQPMANRFLASLSPFISSHLDVPEVSQLVVDNFRSFFRRNVVQYQRPELPVGFVGSVAYYYQRQLQEAAAVEGFTVGSILKSPIEGLVQYHSS